MARLVNWPLSSEFESVANHQKSQLARHRLASQRQIPESHKPIHEQSLHAVDPPEQLPGDRGVIRGEDQTL